MITERFVYGTYLTANELHDVVNDLITRGVDPQAISLVANKSIVRRLDTNLDVINYDDYLSRSKQSGWLDKLFGGKDKSSGSGVDLSGYEDEIDDDYILVVVDNMYEGQAYKLGVPNETTPGIDQDYEEEVDHVEDMVVSPENEVLNTSDMDGGMINTENLEDGDEVNQTMNNDEIIERQELEENYQERLKAEADSSTSIQE